MCVDSSAVGKKWSEGTGERQRANRPKVALFLTFIATDAQGSVRRVGMCNKTMCDESLDIRNNAEGRAERAPTGQRTERSAFPDINCDM